MSFIDDIIGGARHDYGSASGGTAIASAPFGSGITVGGHRFLCAWNPLPPAAKCAQWADGQGLANAMAPLPLTVTVMGETRTLTGGGESPSGVTTTGRRGIDTVLQRISANPTPGTFPWALVVGAGALTLIGFGIWYVTRKPRRRR